MLMTIFNYLRKQENPNNSFWEKMERPKSKNYFQYLFSLIVPKQTPIEEADGEVPNEPFNKFEEFFELDEKALSALFWKYLAEEELDINITFRLFGSTTLYHETDFKDIFNAIKERFPKSTFPFIRDHQKFWGAIFSQGDLKTILGDAQSLSEMIGIEYSIDLTMLPNVVDPAEAKAAKQKLR
eukprot:Platyproteum_vivax@DN4322_c0_g1_i1.p1